jgi:ornithine cyclodeaminase
MTEPTPNPTPTLLLSRSDVVRLMDVEAVLQGLKPGFIAHSQSRRIPARRESTPLPSAGRAMVIFPGLVPSIPAYTVKVHAKFKDQKPAIRGLLLLHDLQTGALLSAMDSGYLTAVRSSLSAALAAEQLSRPDARTVAIVGAGVQGEMQLRHLLNVRQLQSVAVFDVDVARAARLVEVAQKELHLSAHVSPSVADAVLGADIVVTATWSTQPFLTGAMVSKGTHVTALGADEAGKAELDATLLMGAKVVADDRDLSLSQGALHNAELGWEHLHAELGDILAGDKAGRTSPDQITVYSGVGLPFQDLVAAWAVYQAALAKGEGTRFTFLD